MQIIKKIKNSVENVSTRFIYFIAIVYTFISVVHFGFYFYDLDRLITNIFIGFIGFMLGYILYQQEDLKNDFKSLDTQINNRNSGEITK